MRKHLWEEPALDLFGNFQFLCSAALRFEFPSRCIVAHEHEGVPVRVFEAGFHSAPGLRLRWTVKTDPPLGPLLEIGHNIFGNKNNVPGATNKLVFLGVGLWIDKVVFNGSAPDGFGGDIMVMNADGSEIKTILSCLDGCALPDWGPKPKDDSALS